MKYKEAIINFKESNHLADSTQHVQFHFVESEHSSHHHQSQHCKLCSWRSASSTFSPPPDVAISEPIKPVQ